MIRRDYILRMIEEFFQALARIRGLKRGEQWQQAGGAVDEEFQRLIGAGAQAVSQLTETELLARIIQGEPTSAVKEKTLMLSALLKEAGDVAAAQDRPEESRSCHLKGLHLLLQTLASNDVIDCPEFVPQVDAFVAALGDGLPLATQAMLMQHFERIGEFAKAEDALFALLDAEPANAGLLQFGISFCQRLQNHRDDQLVAGNLPRLEVEAALADLRARQASLAPPAR